MKKNDISIILGSVLLTLLTAIAVISVLNKVDGTKGKKVKASWNFSEGNNGVLNMEIVSEDKVKKESEGSFFVVVSNENVKEKTNYKIMIDEKKLPQSISFDEIKKEGSLKPGESKKIEFKWNIETNDNNESIIVDVSVTGEQE